MVELVDFGSVVVMMFRYIVKVRNIVMVYLIFFLYFDGSRKIRMLSNVIMVIGIIRFMKK